MLQGAWEGRRSKAVDNERISFCWERGYRAGGQGNGEGGGAGGEVGLITVT